MKTPVTLPNLFSNQLPSYLQIEVQALFLRIILPLLLFFGLLTELLILLFTSGQKFRLIPGGIGILFLIICSILLKKSKVKSSAIVLFAGFTLTILSGMTFSGGIHAPVFYGIIPAIIIATALFGSRTGVTAGASSILLIILYIQLETRGIIPIPAEPGVLLRGIIAISWGVYALIAILVTFHMMSRALVQSEAERQNALTQKLRAEAAFQQSFQLTGLLNPDGTLLSANQTALDFIGQTGDAVNGHPFEKAPWWPESEQEKLRNAIKKAQQGERVSFETWHHNKNGEPRIIDFTIGPFHNEQGDVVYLIVEGRDITDLVAAKEMLAQREKLDSIGELAGGIAHDFNNMLSGIIGSAEMLSLSNEAPTKDFLSSMNILMTSAERAAELANKLLVFSRRKAGRKELVHFHPVIEQTVALLSHCIDKKIDISTNLSAETDTILVDTTQMQNVILNLGINARDAMPLGGTITISTRTVSIDNASSSSATFSLSPGNYLKISVRDTGTGMDKELQKRIFEPFFTTKGPGKGTGLGLSTAYGTLRSHSGAIYLYSEPGHGSEFQLLIPLSNNTLSGSTLREPPLFSGEGTVLVVDDEEGIRNTTESMLKALGFTVLCADNGEHGVALFEKNHTAIRLVLLDMIMPRMNGVEAFHRIRKISNDVKVLLCSGFAPDDTVGALLDNGLSAVLYKPYRLKELSNAIESVLTAKN